MINCMATCVSQNERHLFH